MENPILESDQIEPRGPAPVKGKVAAECQNCRSEIEVAYVRIGAATICPQCLQYTVPRPIAGAPLPITKYELTWRDFHKLISLEDHRVQVAALLEQWFDYRLVGGPKDTLILNDRNEVIDQLWLHERIQAHARRQRELYKLAMTLWR